MAVFSNEFTNELAEKVAQRVLAALNGKAVGGSDRKLLDIKQAALYLSRSPSTVRHLIATGEIPASVLKRFGRRIYLSKAELDRWVEAQ
jgi:excisionase family DNA binding protein